MKGFVVTVSRRTSADSGDVTISHTFIPDHVVNMVESALSDPRVEKIVVDVEESAKR